MKNATLGVMLAGILALAACRVETEAGPEPARPGTIQSAGRNRVALRDRARAAAAALEAAWLGWLRSRPEVPASSVTSSSVASSVASSSSSSTARSPEAPAARVGAAAGVEHPTTAGTPARPPSHRLLYRNLP